MYIMKRRAIFIILLLMFLPNVNADDNNFKFSKVWDEENAGQHNFFLSSLELSITEIRFVTGTDLKDAKMAVELIDSIPSDFDDSMNIYQYIAIGKFGILDEDINNIWLLFRLKKSWLDNFSDVNNTFVWIKHEKWKKIQPRYLNKDSYFYYFEIKPEIFSYMIITADEVEKKVNENTIQENISMSQESIDDKQKVYSNNFFIRMIQQNKSLFIYSFILTMFLITIIIAFGYVNAKLKGSIYKNTPELNDFVEQELLEGISKSEIKMELINQGWPKYVIDKIVNISHLPVDMEVKIKAYIKTMLEKGINIDKIKALLLQQGWDDEIIESLVNSNN